MTLLPIPKDLAVIWENKVLSGGILLDEDKTDFLLDNPLKSLVMVSLFSEREAPDLIASQEKNIGLKSSGSAVTAFQNPRKGWWADSLDGEKTGSRLWQLARVIKSNGSSVLLETQSIVYEALQWMIKNGIAASINVAANWVKDNSKMVSFFVQIFQSKNGTSETFTFQIAWQNI